MIRAFSIALVLLAAQTDTCTSTGPSVDPIVRFSTKGRIGTPTRPFVDCDVNCLPANAG